MTTLHFTELTPEGEHGSLYMGSDRLCCGTALFLRVDGGTMRGRYEVQHTPDGRRHVVHLGFSGGEELIADLRPGMRVAPVPWRSWTGD